VNVFSATATVFQIGANTTTNDRVNVQGNALTTTMGIGTQTITDRTATLASTDIAASITAASAYANASITGAANQINYVQNTVIDAINSSQKLSFAAKTDALGTLSTLTNAYGQSGTVGATLANFVTDVSAATSNTTPGTPFTLAISSTGGVVGNTYTADANGSSTKFIKFSSATALQLTLGAGAVANGTGTGQLSATQTAGAGQSLALAAINAIDNALTEVNVASSVQGALQNRFSAVISNLNAFSQSQTAAKSRIVDADFAMETAKLSKNQILQQAGTAMLAQANQLPSGVLSLLK
jgi:flagellin